MQYTNEKLQRKYKGLETIANEMMRKKSPEKLQRKASGKLKLSQNIDKLTQVNLIKRQREPTSQEGFSCIWRKDLGHSSTFGQSFIQFEVPQKNCRQREELAQKFE